MEMNLCKVPSDEQD